MVIVLFPKGCKDVVHTCRFGGTKDAAFDAARELLEKHKEAMYYNVFTEKEYEAKFGKSLK